ATSIAPFRILDKVREQIENANVPLYDSAWMTIPTDPALFGLAHEFCEGSFGEKGHFYEGLIVTGTGIKDAIDAKREILKEFPGGLAVEEEGYVVGLMSLVNRTPCLILRGISDRAQGDKQRQGRNLKKEAADQENAAA